MSSAVRVLPLGGLGEIGKNMTVVEHEDRILVVDVGLRFPTAEMVGIDLVLPDFSYLRDRVDDIEGIVVTHGHEDHLGALRGVFDAMAVTTNPIPVKAALNMLGHRVGGLRLPLVEADEAEQAAIRGALERHGLLKTAHT